MSMANVLEKNPPVAKAGGKNQNINMKKKLANENPGGWLARSGRA